jgi:hypothetical protein
LRRLPAADFGTGLGDKKDQELEFVDKPARGLMLAAMTFYYRTEDQLEELRDGVGDDPVLEPDDQVGDNKKDKPDPGEDELPG